MVRIVETLEVSARAEKGFGSSGTVRDLPGFWLVRRNLRCLCAFEAMSVGGALRLSPKHPDLGMAAHTYMEMAESLLSVPDSSKPGGYLRRESRIMLFTEAFKLALQSFGRTRCARFSR